MAAGFADDDRPVEIDDELIGLDPGDPETRAFADHLRRMHNQHSSYTVEGYLTDVQNFATSANRMGGHRKLTAAILVGLILLGVLVAVWDSLGQILHTFLH